MHSLTYKPLRKPANLVSVTDEEFLRKIKEKKKTGRFFAKQNQKSGKRQNGTETRSQKTTIVNDALGKIENLLLTVPPYYDQKNPHIPVDPCDERHFKILIRHLGKSERHYTILCHINQVPAIKKWFSAAKIKSASYTLALTVSNYSIWGQDAYVALNDPENNTILCEGVCFTRDHDMICLTSSSGYST